MLLREISQEEMRANRVNELLHWLTLCPMTLKQIGEVMQIHKTTADSYITQLRGQRKVHICGYENRKTRLYAAGDCEDAVKPVDPVEEEIDERPPVEVIVQRDPLHAALFGEYRRAA